MEVNMNIASYTQLILCEIVNVIFGIFMEEREF